MNLICQRDLLINNINIVLKAVSSKTTLDILECILLDASDNFKLVTSDLEIGIETAPIDSEIIESGKIAVEAKLFSDIIRKLNGETVCISTDDKFSIKISCGLSEFKILGRDAQDFPMLPSVEKEKRFQLKQIKLKNMIRQTIFSISQDETKPTLSGELIEIKNRDINIVSVDGYRISLRKEILEQIESDISVIVPGKTLNEISKILSSEETEDVYIYITEKHILFDLGIAIVVSRLIEGEFIKYAQNFTNDFKTRINVEKNMLISSLERSLLVSRDSKKMPVKFEIKDMKLIITSNTETGTFYDELIVEMEGDDIVIAFNPKYLIDALKVIDDNEICISFTTSLSPCIISPLQGNLYKYLILPLRM